MGWYLRKSISSGPIRFNLSKSGVGLSLGVRGARVGVGPKGGYLHAGRNGVYYRTNLSPGSSRSSSQSTGQTGQATTIQTDHASPLYNERQIFKQKAHIEVSITRRHTKDIILCITGFISLLISGVASEPSNLGEALAPYSKTIVLLSLSAAGMLFFISAVDNIHFWILKMVALVRYRSLKKKSMKIENQEPEISWHDLREDLNRKPLPEVFMSQIKAKLFCDYLEAVILNDNLSDKETTDLQLLEETFKFDPELAKRMKRWAFNLIYLRVIDDMELTQMEEEEIFKLQKVFKLSNADIEDEVDTLNTLSRIRQIRESGLQSVELGISLQKGEKGYHKTQGKLVKEKVLKSFQSQGVRHKITGLVVDREGDLYLTNKRIIVVGDGAQSIKLDKIFDVETDIDKNLLLLTVDGRKNELAVTVPDSLLFSAKLNYLLKTGVGAEPEEVDVM